MSNELSGVQTGGGLDVGPSDGHDSHRPVRSFEDVADTRGVRDILRRVGGGIWGGLMIFGLVLFLLGMYPYWALYSRGVDDDF